MATSVYDFRCDLCGSAQERWIPIRMYEPDAFPRCPCCGNRMRRDYQGGAGIAYRSKGIYPVVDTNMGHEPVVIESHDHKVRLLKERGLHEREPSRESIYKRRHIKDLRVPSGAARR